MSKGANRQAVLLRSAAGDLEALRQFENMASHEILDGADLPDLKLRRSAVSSVLAKLKSDPTQRSIVGRWAWFMLRGYVRPRGKGEAIDTRINTQWDQLTVDILFQLDLPDPLTSAKIDDWRRRLEDNPSD